jgi:hypothetical protein
MVCPCSEVFSNVNTSKKEKEKKRKEKDLNP